MTTDSESTKTCPFCGGTIPAAATQCKHCREVLDAKPADAEQPDPSPAMPSIHAVGVDTKELFRVQPSMFALLGTFFWCLLLVVAGSFFAFLSVERIPLIGKWLDAPFVVKWKMIIGLGVMLAAILWLIYRAVALKCIVYSATNDRLEWERGIFNRPVDNLDLFRIEDLSLHRPFIDRLLGIGTIEIHSSDKTTSKLMLKKIPDPKRIYDLLKTESLRSDRRRGVIHMD